MDSSGFAPIMGDRLANPIYFSDGFYRAALVTAIALTVLSAVVGAMCFPLGSQGFYAMSLTAGVGFSVVVALIIRGCIKTKKAVAPTLPLTLTFSRPSSLIRNVANGSM